MGDRATDLDPPPPDQREAPAGIAGAVPRIADSPLAIGVLAGVAGLAFVVARLAVAAHGDVGNFVVAGRLYVTPHAVAVPVGGGSGYDGQFYYRMALDPAQLAARALGVRLDSTARLGRIGYPALAWLLSGGRRSLVPTSLVAVNTLALGVLGWAAALLARSSGRRAAWGLVLPAYFGYLWSLGRDLTEITAAAFLVLGLYAYRRHRFLAAGVALAGAVLCKETSAYVVLAFGLTRLVPLVWHRRWRAISGEDLAWGVPLVAFVGWQAVVAVTRGQAPVLASGSANVGPPLVGVAQGVHHYLLHPLHSASLLWWGELAVLVVLTVAAAASLGHTTVPPRERAAWAAVVVLALCAAAGIWRGDVGFRSLDAVYLFDWIVLLGSARRLWPLATVTGAAWLVVAVELVRFV